jgi:hypothetical protein
MEQVKRPPETPPQRLITPQEEQEYGPEFLDLVSRKVQETAGSEITSLKSQVQDLTKQLRNVGSHVQKDSLARMYEYLGQQVPNWEALNTNEDFMNWLRLPDSYSGEVRGKLLERAYQRHDAPRVAAFFQGFLAEEAAITPAAAEPGVTTQGKVSLESLAAPGRAKSAAGSPPAEKPIITRDQIKQFHADVASGKWLGREKDKESWDRVIWDAMRDGRIR